MICKEKPYRVGAVVTTRAVTSYPLPDGLPEGVTVRVKAFDIGSRTVEYEGREFHLAMVNVSAGFLYQFRGRWLAGNHPHVMAEKQRLKQLWRNTSVFAG